ncbi:MAG: hypothetical protein HYX84_01550 [Chloroflexi bacterium]|nr:hypothetical protein [Chloroflexota bacterium]
MGKKARRQPRQQQRKRVDGFWQRYSLWVVGGLLGIVIVGIVFLVSQGNQSSSAALAVPRLEPEAVKAKMDAGTRMTIVDTRSAFEYEQSHISGAVSIPVEEIPVRYTELDRGSEIITYCT